MAADEDPNTIDFGDEHSAQMPADEDTPAWDADDERRRKDQFAPPNEPCECYCLHCNRVFMSDGIWFQRVIGDKHGFEGFWRCPTPNCSGAGFTFDIFPTDPHHPANAGWSYDEDEPEDGEFCEEFSDFPPVAGMNEIDAPEWDPSEPMYQSMDFADDDIEGEEWKYGLEPGEQLADSTRPPNPAREEWEEEQRLYDSPDERPRELDWSNREDREGEMPDDIPF